MTCAWYLKVYLYGFKAVPAYGFTVYGHPSAVRGVSHVIYGFILNWQVFEF